MFLSNAVLFLNETVLILHLPQHLIFVFLDYLTGAQLGGGGRRFPLPFFDNRKNCHDFGKNGPDCTHLCVKFSIQNVVLRVSRTKNTKIFPCFFSYVFDEMFIKVPKFHENSPDLKNFLLHPCLR